MWNGTVSNHVGNIAALLSVPLENMGTQSTGVLLYDLSSLAFDEHPHVFFNLG